MLTGQADGFQNPNCRQAGNVGRIFLNQHLYCSLKMKKKYFQTLISLLICIIYCLWIFGGVKNNEYENLALSFAAMITAGISLLLVIISLILILSKPKKYKFYWVYNFTGIFFISLSILLIEVQLTIAQKVNYLQLLPSIVLLALGLGIMLDIFILKSPIL